MNDVTINTGDESSDVNGNIKAGNIIMLINEMLNIALINAGKQISVRNSEDWHDESRQRT